MHLELPHRTYTGPALDDPEILDRLPTDLATALRRTNGAIGWMGGLHVRGACRQPAWHSLRHAWEGPDSLHELFPEVRPTNVPFAEDAFGDQFLLRDGRVVRLAADLGELSDVAGSLDLLFERLWADAELVLDYRPLLRYRERGGELRPGELLGAYPPLRAGRRRHRAAHPPGRRAGAPALPCRPGPAAPRSARRRARPPGRDGVTPAST